MFPVFYIIIYFFASDGDMDFFRSQSYLSIAGQRDKIGRASTRRTFLKADLGFVIFSN